MTSPTYSRVLNFAWYQLLWFTAVIGGSTLAWLLPALLLLHLLQVRTWRSELLLMVSVALLGCAVDSAIAAAGFYHFDSSPQGLPIPAWLAAIWLGFAGTLRHSMAWLSARPGLMALLASVGAPLTYLAASRLGAVGFPLGTWPTVLVVGLAWLALTPTLCRLAAYSQRFESRSLQNSQLFFTREVNNG